MTSRLDDCQACDGNGATPHATKEDHWNTCPACGGMGSIWTPSVASDTPIAKSVSVCAAMGGKKNRLN